MYSNTADCSSSRSGQVRRLTSSFLRVAKNVSATEQSFETSLLGGPGLECSAPRDFERRAVIAQCGCPVAGQPAELPGASLYGPGAVGVDRVAVGLLPTWCVATV